MAGEIIIKKLEAAEIDRVSSFSMEADEDRPLQNFIRRRARKSAEASLTQTYVAKVKDERQVLAYISIMCAEVRLENAYELPDKLGANVYAYQPAVRIARLACCDKHKGTGLGRQLVETVIGLVLISIAPHAGCRFLIVDAKRKSVAFYRRLGFRLLQTPENRASENPVMFLDLRSVVEEEEEA